MSARTNSEQTATRDTSPAESPPRTNIQNNHPHFRAMNRLKTFSLLLTLAIATVSCNKQKSGSSNDWLYSDNVHIAVDETFQPIIEEELQLFGARHPEAGLYPIFVSENEALRLLVSDSIRLCIATRQLSDKEKSIVESHTLRAKQALFAYDAFALIVNKSLPDSLITLDEIRDIVTGKITRWEQLSRSAHEGELNLVFDNEGSSTVRYITDSLCQGKALAGNVFAQGSNLKVIETVKERTDVIGVVGADWLKEKGDSALSSFDQLDVKVMRVSRFTGAGEEFVRPYQYHIATGRYPLVRTVYVITTDPRTKSMTKNFFHFLKGQPAQLVICNSSQMLPIMPVQVKSVSAD